MTDATASEPGLVIALVNNMPDAALKAAERQFRTIIQEAAGSIEVCFKYFFLPEIPRGESGVFHFSQCYNSLASLWTSRVDGLIVTGAVPKAASFEDEPYWPSFCQVADWAEDNGIPSYWSCLAAHAAVKHFDGIERRRLDRKLSGVFECHRTADHPLLRDAPDRWKAPHSRYNCLIAEDLTGAGYRILSRLRNGSPDIFIRRRNSLAVFAQGHLEYDRETLLYEYRRDLGKYLSGESLIAPHMPEDYLDGETAQAVMTLSKAVQVARPNEAGIKSVAALLANAKLTDGWRPTAIKLFSNWLTLVLEERAHKRIAKSFRPSRTEQLATVDLEWRAE